MKRILVAVSALILLVSCTKGTEKKGEYVAKIDSTTISVEDAKKEMNALPEMAKNFFQGPEGPSKFTDELVKREMLYLEAKKKGLDKAEEFQKKVEDFKKITLINQLLEKEIESWSKVTDEDAKKYYDAHKDEFTVNSQVRVSHIVVKTEEEARKVYERLKQGEEFAKVAAATSLDKASAKAGGDIGSFKRGEMAPELEEVAFRLKKGEVSMPVKLKDGIHILKATDAKGTAVDFDKVKGVVTQRLTAEKQREGFDKYIENLKKSYKVETNKDAIAKLSAVPSAPPEKQGEQGKPEKQEKPEQAKPEQKPEQKTK